MQQLIVIEGATASGKTAIAVALAKQLNTVVISADSRQFYQELSIGSAKPTPEEMDGIPHYFVDSHSIHTPITAAQFEKEALEIIQKELSHYPQLIIVGGSGLFMDALCIGFDPIPTDVTIQQQLRLEARKNGLSELLEELKQTDFDYYQLVDKNNEPRVLRALEVIRNTGKPFTEWRKRMPPPRPFSVQRFVINHPREVLYERINLRVDQMIHNGLLQEAQSLVQFRHLTSLKTVGYTECFDFFDGNISRETCIELIKQHTRNFAKRQLTWFRRHPESIWIDFVSTEQLCSEIVERLLKTRI